MKQQTQHQAVKKLLKNWTSPRDALAKAGCFRLAAVVHRLKSEGLEIEDIYPKGAKYKLYRIVK